MSGPSSSTNPDSLSNPDSEPSDRVVFPEAGPRRTCVACREEGDRADLLRLVAAPSGELVVDLRARLPGRGAWLHPQRRCVDVAASRGGILARALGVSGSTTDVAALIRASVHASALDALTIAAKAGALVGGFDVLEASLRRGEVVDVVLASDASDRTVAALRDIAPIEVSFTPVDLDRDALGARIGRGARAAVGVLRSKACAPLQTQLRRLRALS